MSVFLLLSVVSFLGLRLIVSGRWRERDVLHKLREHRAQEDKKEVYRARRQFAIGPSQDELCAAGFFTQVERLRYGQQLRLVPWGNAILCGALMLCFTQDVLLSTILFFIGLSGGYLFTRRDLFLKKKRLIEEIDFFLPVVMERLVMAAQAGLDIFSGIRVITRLAREEAARLGEQVDPVTQLLERACTLHERGIGFEEALSQVASEVENPALRHAFIHLSVSQKQGGELVQPLRELSDSTQLYYQETVDEQIAKLPVKATLPLVLTFAGLVIFFMTSPLIQIMKLSSNAMVK
jgi:Flp pilus assembly protein TadB